MVKKAGTRSQKFPLKELHCESVPVKEDIHHTPGAGRERLQLGKEETLTKSSPSSRCKLGERPVISTCDKHVHVLMFEDDRTCLIMFRRLL